MQDKSIVFGHQKHIPDHFQNDRLPNCQRAGKDFKTPLFLPLSWETYTVATKSPAVPTNRGITESCME